MFRADDASLLWAHPGCGIHHLTSPRFCSQIFIETIRHSWPLYRLLLNVTIDMTTFTNECARHIMLIKLIVTHAYHLEALGIGVPWNFLLEHTSLLKAMLALYIPCYTISNPWACGALIAMLKSSILIVYLITVRESWSNSVQMIQFNCIYHHQGFSRR